MEDGIEVQERISLAGMEEDMDMAGMEEDMDMAGMEEDMDMAGMEEDTTGMEDGMQSPGGKVQNGPGMEM